MRAGKAVLRLRSVLGQTGTEYFLVIAVVVVAVAAAAYVYVPGLRDGTSKLAFDVSTILDTHQIGGMSINGAAPGTSTGTTGVPTSAPGPNGAQPSGAGPSGNNNKPGANTNWQQSNGILGGILNKQESDPNAGTGGNPNKTNVAGAVSAGNNGPVSQAASTVPPKMQGKAICMVAIAAALTGKSVPQTYADLQRRGLLDNVQTQWKLFGFIPIPLSGGTEQNGVMKFSNLAAYLKDVGMNVNYQSSGGNIAQLQTALASGESPVVLYDNQDGSGLNGHAVVVTGVSGGKVWVDGADGSYGIPVATFQQHWNADGGQLITASPPPAAPNSGSYADGR